MTGHIDFKARREKAHSARSDAQLQMSHQRAFRRTESEQPLRGVVLTQSPQAVATLQSSFASYSYGPRHVLGLAPSKLRVQARSGYETSVPMADRRW